MIERAIHHRWEESEPLALLLPAARFTTGSRLDENATLPAGVLMLEDTRRTRSNSGHVKTRGVRIKVWDHSHQDGTAIRDQVEAAFDNKSWSLTVDGETFRVIVCRITNDFWIQEDDGSFQFVFDLELTTSA